MDKQANVVITVVCPSLQNGKGGQKETLFKYEIPLTSEWGFRPSVPVRMSGLSVLYFNLMP
jgi:hypothetical protein